MKSSIPNIAQSFYDSFASKYDKLYQDWQSATIQEAEMLDRIFRENGFDSSSCVLDCACGIGTQTIGLAAMGYCMTASDISTAEIEEAKRRAEEQKVAVHFERADFRALSDTFSEKFDIVIAIDNALPHMLSKEELEKAVKSIVSRITDGGMFVASIRDYDRLLEEKPAYSAPYIHKTENGQRVSFQTWDWTGDNYTFIQYIIEDEGIIETSRFECEYRAVRRDELTELLLAHGCKEAVWKFPEETGFYQPIVIARK